MLASLDGWTDAQVPNRTALIAKAAAHTGYIKVLLAEAMCTVALDSPPPLNQ